MDTIGHDAPKERFATTLRRGRLASTYLFVGPGGVGKRTFAIDLARTLLCASPALDTLSACGRCESCRLCATDAHPDLLRVAKPAGKSTLPLELFLGRPEHRNREGLCHEIALKPYLATRRIAVIDDADDLSTESANCLLKTLEEPPPRSVLILIGTSLSKQLPTIRSRAQVVRFDRLSTDELTRVLVERQLLEEGQDAGALAMAGAGSVAEALAATDQGLVDFRAHVVTTLNAPRFDPIRFATEVIEQSQAGAAEPAVRRQRLRAIVGYAIDHYRQTLRGDAEGQLTGDGTIALLEASLTAVEQIDRNANQASVVQAWAVELAKLSRAGAVASVG